MATAANEVNIVEPDIDLDMKRFGQTIRGIKAAWQERDIQLVSRHCTEILEHEPENLYGLIYLARAAAVTEDCDVLFATARKLTRRSPRYAFNAARRLNGLGRPREAATIFASLEIKPDWFDVKLAELGHKQGNSLLKAGDAAYHGGDAEAARVLWVGGSRIAPRNRLLRNRIAESVRSARDRARANNLDENPTAYLEGWAEVLEYDPTDISSLSRLARGFERSSVTDAVSTWVRVLVLEPANERAIERVRKLVAKFHLEDHAIRLLTEKGQNADADPLLQELVDQRDLKAKTQFADALKLSRKDALLNARQADRAKDPRSYLEAWKEVLVLDAMNLGATRKIISVARELEDYAELVEALITHLEIIHDDPDMALRLASAAPRAGQEERALGYLARKGLADLSVPQIANLHKKVLRACQRAMKALDFDYALDCFAALELADREHTDLQAIRPLLAARAGATARVVEKQGNLTTAVPLAWKVLAIKPEQPHALTVVARDLWRHKKFDEIVALCRPQITSAREYATVQKMLDKLGTLPAGDAAPPM